MRFPSSWSESWANRHKWLGRYPVPSQLECQTINAGKCSQLIWGKLTFNPKAGLAKQGVPISLRTSSNGRIANHSRQNHLSLGLVTSVSQRRNEVRRQFPLNVGYKPRRSRDVRQLRDRFQKDQNTTTHRLLWDPPGSRHRN